MEREGFDEEEREGFEGTDLAMLAHLENPKPCKGRPCKVFREQL